tara:strand:- start:67 stop:756 length:690 start_codon:yes stop_codon:yes gene_type:complete
MKKSIARKGQVTLFIIIGVVLLVLAILFYSFSGSFSSNSTKSLAVIESLEQASDAVESCLDDMVEEKFYFLGENGGYVSEQRSDSSFGISNDLPSNEDMEEELIDYFLRYAGSCAEVLDGTSFSVSEKSFNVVVSLGEDVNIEIESIGSVDSGESNSMALSSVSKQYDIDFEELQKIVAEFYNEEHGVQVEEYEGYVSNVFFDEEYTEMLLELYHVDTGFVFKITKVLS